MTLTELIAALIAFRDAHPELAHVPVLTMTGTRSLSGTLTAVAESETQPASVELD